MSLRSPVPAPQPAAPVEESAIGPSFAASPSAIPSSRAGRAWVQILPALAVVALGLAFILQNLHHANVNFLTFSGSVPVAVALLAAFALGAVSVLLLGSIRILQLRKIIRGGARIAGPEASSRERL
jgi:putative membrane protein